MFHTLFNFLFNEWRQRLVWECFSSSHLQMKIPICFSLQSACLYENAVITSQSFVTKYTQGNRCIRITNTRISEGESCHHIHVCSVIFVYIWSISGPSVSFLSCNWSSFGFLSSLNTSFERVSGFKGEPKAAIICARIQVNLNTLYKTRNLMQLKIMKIHVQVIVKQTMCGLARSWKQQ
jgi:hypothetical protein